MTRRKKNAGKGFGMMFHGSFADKSDAKKKERQVHGFIKPTVIDGKRRYTVMSERKNPRQRKPPKPGMGRHVVMWDPAHGQASTVSLKTGSVIRGYGETKRRALADMRKKLTEEYKRNPMDLVVMGANPHGEETKEIVVHPGQTITLKVTQ